MKHDNLLALFLVTLVCVFPAKAGSFSKISVGAADDGEFGR